MGEGIFGLVCYPRPLQPEADPSSGGCGRGKGEGSVQPPIFKGAGDVHRSASRKVPLTVATAEAPMRKESSGLSTLMRIGKRAAGRIQPSEGGTSGGPFTVA